MGITRVANLESVSHSGHLAVGSSGWRLRSCCCLFCLGNVSRRRKEDVNFAPDSESHWESNLTQEASCDTA